MQVLHNTFGTGIVISQDDKNITVDFNGNTKILVTAFARLTNMDGTPLVTPPVAKTKSKKLPKNFAFDKVTERTWSDWTTDEKYQFEQEQKMKAYRSCGLI